jgi:signal transduction histidine kinase
MQREQLLTQVRRGEQMKAIGTLAAGLAHEIKNPLSSIKTFTEHLEARYDDPEFRGKFIKIVGGEVERMNLIVQRLLDFAKPAPPKLAPLSISAIIDGTLELLGDQLVERHVTIERAYAAQSVILGDAQQLRQVLLNLFLNSLQAMNGHGRLSVSTALSDTELIVTIADSGCGIPPKDLQKVFDPFFSTKPAGTGLGLAVARNIIEEHGGRIEIVSGVGQGTRVSIRFPTGTQPA